MFHAKLAAYPGHVLAPRREPIDRTFHGLLVTGLLEDIRAGGPHTLIAPTNAAYDALPWAFEDLVYDGALAEARFDLFEYLVVRGDWYGGGPVSERKTVEGTPLRIGHGLVLGRQGTATILRSFESDNLRVHVVDACILPVSLGNYIAVRDEVYTAQLC